MTEESYSPRPETGYGLDAGALELAGESQGSQPGPTALVGSSGYGKSCLAAGVLLAGYRSGDCHLQVWVDASSPSAVLTAYAAAASELGLADRRTRAGPAADQFLDWLRRTDRPWQVVLDNVTDPAGLRGLWPDGPAGQVLVTCHQSADLSGVAGARVREVGAFSPREALSYLTSRLYEAEKRVGAVDLAADLRYMPFALGLAAATMNSTALDCRGYRLILASRKDELLGGVPEAQMHPADAAWALALEQADQQPPAGLARIVLTLLALLDPAGTPSAAATCPAALDYLSGHSRGVVVDERQVLAAIANLARAGLATVDRSAGFDLVALHPVVSETVRRLMPGALLDHAAQAAAQALLEVWPETDNEPALEQALRGCAAALDGSAESRATCCGCRRPIACSCGRGPA